MSENESLDMLNQFNFKSKEFGVILALLEEGPTISISKNRIPMFSCSAKLIPLHD